METSKSCVSEYFNRILEKEAEGKRKTGISEDGKKEELKKEN
jgi:hypothetical protein